MAEPNLVLDKTAPQFFQRGWNWALRRLILLLGLAADILAVIFAFYSAYWLRFHFHPLLRLIPPPHGHIASWSDYSPILPVVALIWVAVLFFGVEIHQEPPLPTEDKIVRILSGSFKATIVVMALSFLSKRYSDSRLLLLMTAPLASLYLAADSAFLNWIRWKILTPLGGQDKLLVIGEGPLSDSIIKRISRLQHRQILKKPALSRTAILDLARSENVSDVLLVQADLTQEEMASLAEGLESLGAQMRVVPSLLELRMGEVQVDESLGVPTFYFKHGSLSGENFIIKRVFDIVFSFSVCVLGFIPFAFIALLIKIDSKGPVLFRQKRYGLYLRVFDALKFRTMVADAESKLDQAQEASAAGAFFKVKNDPRVTRVGKFLRRFSLDEFPQFLNVLMGDMSVVGPRPLALRDLDRLKENFGPAYKKRLSVLPGVTGLWQVSGRSDLSNEQSFALDTFYIEHWSLGLDIKIILKTIPAVLFGKGAY